MKWIVCCLLALSSAAPAMAQTSTVSPFTFTVPVRVENAPGVTRVNIDCLVSRLDAGVDGYAAESNIIARGNVNVNVTGGRYSGDVSVPTVLRVATPAGARGYACQLTLAGPHASGSGMFGVTNAAGYTRMTGHAVTSSTMAASGVVP